ncbi:MAG: F0F1 ATP synthase subunit gamma [Ignavibacteria bacterium]|nr:F0F1 ATP synthase subunit gamma [Ignavibacteria bacterium]
MVDVIVVGRRGADFVKRNKLGNLVAEFANFENIASYNDIMPISKLSNELYLEKKYKEVIIIYSFFESSLKHTPVVEKILPISDEHIDMQNLWEKDENNIKNDYLFEPESQEIIEKILIQIIRTQLYGAILEANASEYASRMIAMKNATDNAKNLIDELSLLYNSIRQSSITAEIAEISNASEAMK